MGCGVAGCRGSRYLYLVRIKINCEIQKNEMRILFLIACFVFQSCSKNKGGGSGGSQPSVSISSLSQAEGNTGTTLSAFTVTLSKASSTVVNVTYSTQEGSAKGAEDFTAVSNQTISFQPNEISKTIPISVITDDK